MNNKIIKITAVLGATLALASCSGFLDEDLKGSYTSKNLYTTESKALATVNGVYNSLYGNTQWIFGDVASDDAVKGGNAGDQAEIDRIDDFTANADNGVISTYWQNTYETIARANNAIAEIGAMTFKDETLRNRYVAEAKLLRAYSYFNLVNIFGKVPLKTEPQNSVSGIYVGLSEIDRIYSKIDEDLSEAAAALPKVYPTEAGRVTSGTAYGLLAKSKLFQKKYNEALAAIQSLQELGIYSLESNYADLFKAGAEDSKESIFAIRYVNNTSVSLGNNLNVWFSPAAEGGYYFNAPTQDYVNCFDDANDIRLDASIGREGKPWFNEKTFSQTWSEATGYLVKKYNEDMSEGFAKSQSVVPQHILRYADIILMKAEALNETGKTSEALEELKAIRLRAGISPVPASNQDAARELIRQERRRELGFEFHRFFDVVRYGKEYAVSALGENFKWESDRYYFPIPQAEIETNTEIK